MPVHDALLLIPKKTRSRRFESISMTLVFVGCLIASFSSAAATVGRVIAEQSANAQRNIEAMSVEFKLTQAIAYPTSWVSDEARYQVLLAAPDTDISGIEQSLDPERWVATLLRDANTRAVKITVDTDGDVVAMNLYADGKMDIGGSGTMGNMYGPALKNGRLSGHYLHLDDVFGSPVFIDVMVDAPIWKMPNGTAIASGGGEIGQAYLATIAAIMSGDEAKIRASRPDKAMDASVDFKRMLPLLQSMIPSDPKIEGGTVFGARAVLNVSGKRAGKVENTRVVMLKEGSRWVMESSSSSDRKPLAAPPAFANTQPDLCPVMTGAGIFGGDTSFKEQRYQLRHALAVRSDDEAYSVLLAETPLDQAHLSALWDSDAKLEPLYKEKPMRSLLLNFGGSSGGLSADSGYAISAEGEFKEEFALRGQAMLIGSRLIGQYIATKTDPESGEGTTVSVTRFELPIIDAR